MLEITPENVEPHHLLIDVREASEYDYEHIPGSFLYPLSYFDPELFHSFGDKEIVLICAVGKRSTAAYLQLHKSGYAMDHVINLSGGIKAWREAGLELEGTKFEVVDFSI